MAECRICLEGNDNEPLINPCRCNGTTKWIHESCLQQWRLSNTHSESYNRCEICLYNYVIIKGPSEEKFIFKFINKYNYPLIDVIMSILFTMLLGNIIWLIDVYNNFQSIEIFNLNTTIVRRTISNDNNLWFIWTYYQALSNFIMNIMFFFIFHSFLCFKIKNKKKYYKLSLVNNIIFFVYMMNFPLISGLSGYYNSTALIEFWGPMFSSIFLTIICRYLKNHNKYLNSINRELPDDRIQPYRRLATEDIIIENFNINSERQTTVINPLNIIDEREQKENN